VPSNRIRRRHPRAVPRRRPSTPRRVQRILRRFFVDIGARCPPVVVTRGGDDDVVDVELPGRSKHVLGAVTVDGERLIPAVVGGGRAGNRREVDHRVDTANGTLYVTVLADVTAPERQLVVDTASDIRW